MSDLSALKVMFCRTNIVYTIIVYRATSDFRAFFTQAGATLQHKPASCRLGSRILSLAKVCYLLGQIIEIQEQQI